MKPQPKTLVLIALASGMLASAYMIAPAPGATASTAPQATARLAPSVTPSKLASNIKPLQAPVPLLVGKHDRYFDASTVADTPPSGTTPAVADTQQASAAPSDVAAKTSIELDGYRNVRALVRSPDGVWRGKAMRGSTEIAVRVNASGGVSVD